MNLAFELLIYAIIGILLFAIAWELYNNNRKSYWVWPYLHTHTDPAIIKIERGHNRFIVHLYESTYIIPSIEKDPNLKAIITKVIPSTNMGFEMHSFSYKTHILEREMVEEYPETWELELARKHLKQWAQEQGLDSLVNEI